jgi:hypothetical protein
MGENDENKDKLSVDEEAKKQFLEELKNKNMEEKRRFEEIKRKKEQEKEEQLKREEEEKQKKLLEEQEAEKKLDESSLQSEKPQEEDTKIDNFKTDSAEIEPVSKKKTSDRSTDLKVKNNLVPCNLKLSIIDTAVSAVVSLACLYLFDLILRTLFGHYIADMKGMYIILFLIVSILYPVIMRSCKSRKTLGEKFAKVPKGVD